jgi:hypothetical protein
MYLAKKVPIRPPRGFTKLNTEMKDDAFFSVHPNFTMKVSIFGLISIIERPKANKI